MLVHKSTDYSTFVVNYQVLPQLFCAASDRKLGGRLERWLFAGAD